MRELFAKNVLFDVKDFGGMSEAEMDLYIEEKTLTYMKYLYVRIAIGVLLGVLLIGVPSVWVMGFTGVAFIFMGGMFGGLIAFGMYGNKRERALLRLGIYERNRLEDLANADLKDAIQEVKGQSDSFGEFRDDTSRGGSVTYLDNEETRKYLDRLED